MRRLTIAVALLAVVAAVWLWGFGGADRVAIWATGMQRDVQNALARALRALQGGQPGALATLWGLCFAYGFFHAAGPGHGKFVIGGYGLAERVPMLRLAGLALASSLAQALTAVALVAGGIALLDLGREQLQGLADRTLAQLSAIMIGGIGLWLVWRGLRALRPAPAAPDMGLAGLGNSLSDDAYCADCGHAHGPTLHQVRAARTLRDGLMIVAAIAARPCTGALFLLILTWQVGLFWAGVVGALVMGLGTATVTVVVAAASVSLRESAFLQAATGAGALRLMSVSQIAGGGLIAALALTMATRGG